MFSLSDYDYSLPDNFIAQHPVIPAENARLLIFERETKKIRDKHFYDLPELLYKDTLLIFNDSKVVKARLLFPEIHGEMLFLRTITPTSCEALVRPGKKRKEGMSHTIPNTDITFTVKETTLDGRIVACSHPILAVLEQYGQMPLPPYIEYDPNDVEHYQPVIADNTKPGSVAAPTAALHFSENLLHNLDQKGIQRETVTLHVGIGTFKTVDVEDITKYAIHDEICEVRFVLFSTIAQQKSEHKPLLVVGTTSTRTLESLPYVWVLLSDDTKLRFDVATRGFRNQLTQDIDLSEAKKFVADISATQDICFFSCTLYIYPGFQFRVIDQLITNFHLPKSSLLMLVAAYVGFSEMKALYNHAITHKYRFFSFGDGMLVM